VLSFGDFHADKGGGAGESPRRCLAETKGRITGIELGGGRARARQPRGLESSAWAEVACNIRAAVQQQVSVAASGRATAMWGLEESKRRG
jgi:hypothetical protein